MRWLLDQGLPRATTLLLAAAAHDAIHVGEIDMAAASDAERGKRGPREEGSGMVY